MSDDAKDIFISYNWAIKEQVKQLYDILTENNKYKVWMDDKDLETSNKPLTSQLGTNILKSKLFLCCITEEYCKSYNCNLEIEYANSKGKSVIPLMIEKISKIEEIKVNGRDHESGVDFIISSMTRLNCYKDSNWPIDKKTEILNSIETCLKVSV